MNIRATIPASVVDARIERVRAFVRSQTFAPMTAAECDDYRAGLRAAAHSNAIEANPFDAGDWALFDMLIEERATDQVRLDALHCFQRASASASAQLAA